MLEIILLYFLTKNIGVLATSKGMPARRWKVYTILGWICFEVAGFIISSLIVQNLIANAFFGLVCAFAGYLLPKYLLEKMPDQTNTTPHWTDRLGNNS